MIYFNDYRVSLQKHISPIFILIVIFAFLYFNGASDARPDKKIQRSAERSISSYGGGLDYGYEDNNIENSGIQNNFTKKYSAGKKKRYASSYARGHTTLHAHLTSAIVIFCTFIIVAMIGAIHFINIKKMNESNAITALKTSNGSLCAEYAVSSQTTHFTNENYVNKNNDHNRPFIIQNPLKPLSSLIPDKKIDDNYKDINHPDLNSIKKRIDECFKKLMQISNCGELMSGEQYMSRRLFYKLQKFLEDCAYSQEKNVIENIKIEDIKIIEIQYEKCEGEGAMKAFIKYSALDYTINECDISIIKGGEYLPVKTCAIWSFVLTEKGWAADEISSY